MHTKFVLFLVPSVLLVTAIYGSSITSVFADARTVICDKGKLFNYCVVNNSESNNLELWKCAKNIDYKTWKCGQVKNIRKPSTTHDALDLGLQMQSSESFGNLTNPNTTTFEHPNNFVTIVNQTTGNSTPQPPLIVPNQSK